MFLHQIDESYITTMAEAGFQKVFSTLQLNENAEEDLTTLANICLEHQLQLVLDVHPAVFQTHPIDSLSRLGIQNLRLDDGFELEDMKQLSSHFKLILNASTITEQVVMDLLRAGIPNTRLEAWHNYYPHAYTGLDETFFNAQNDMLQKYGIETAAFIHGDVLRGPLFEGLPTIESHRQLSPFASYLRIKDSVDHVLVGDLQISPASIHQLKQYVLSEQMTLRVKLLKAYAYVEKQLFHNRPDEAAYVIRFAESRTLYKREVPVDGAATARAIGAITIDNASFGRYEGEIQIVKKAMLGDSRVNWIGEVIEEDLPLIQLIRSNQAIQLEVISWI